MYLARAVSAFCCCSQNHGGFQDYWCQNHGGFLDYWCQNHGFLDYWCQNHGRFQAGARTMEVSRTVGIEPVPSILVPVPWGRGGGQTAGRQDVGNQGTKFTYSWGI